MVSRYLSGDVVSRRKGLAVHKGIAVGNGWIFHNTPFGGERITTEEEFRRGRRLQVERLARRERLRTLQAAECGQRRGYNLFTNNCEHTVSRARTGAGNSPQLKSWALGLGAGALAFAVTRHPAAAVAGYVLGRRIGNRMFNEPPIHSTGSAEQV